MEATRVNVFICTNDDLWNRAQFCLVRELGQRISPRPQDDKKRSFKGRERHGDKWMSRRSEVSSKNSRKSGDLIRWQGLSACSNVESSTLCTYIAHALHCLQLEESAFFESAKLHFRWTPEGKKKERKIRRGRKAAKVLRAWMNVSPRDKSYYRANKNSVGHNRMSF